MYAGAQQEKQQLREQERQQEQGHKKTTTSPKKKKMDNSYKKNRIRNSARNKKNTALIARRASLVSRLETIKDTAARLRASIPSDRITSAAHSVDTLRGNRPIPFNTTLPPYGLRNRCCYAARRCEEK